MKTLATLLVLLLVSSLVSTLAIAPSPPQKPPARPIPGGYVTRDVNDPRIQKVAKFAVTEYNKQSNANLTFDRVVGAESQVVAGVNYILVIAAKEGNTVKLYQAEVHEKLDGFLKLTSVVPLLKAPSPTPAHGTKVGAYQPIEDVKVPHVQEIARYAVTEHNKRAHTNLTFVSVLRGYYQVVAGVNYRLAIAAKNGKFVSNYEAIVYERAWEGFRNLTSFKPLYQAV